MTETIAAPTLDTTTLLRRIVPGRRIDGISAILLPIDDGDRIDLDGLVGLLERTVAARLQPAVNMDTGYVNLLSHRERFDVLATTQAVMAGRPFVAGAFVEGEAGDPRTLYRREVETVRAHGGTPILFQCAALKRMTPAEIVALYAAVAAACDRLLVFELGEMFAPFGQIYDLDLVRKLMLIPQVAGRTPGRTAGGRLRWRRRPVARKSGDLGPPGVVLGTLSPGSCTIPRRTASAQSRRGFVRWVRVQNAWCVTAREAPWGAGRGAAAPGR